MGCSAREGELRTMTTRQAQGRICCSSGNSSIALKGAEEAQQEQPPCREEAGPKSNQDINLARQSWGQEGVRLSTGKDLS